MLSVVPLGGGGAEYYKKDDYYFSSKEDGPDGNLQWFGEGAKILGLRGVARAEDFSAVMGGRNPNPEGAPLSQLERRGGDESGGKAWDFTFSAPKSVSLLYLVGGDQRLQAAHEKAVDAAMSYAERELAVTRVRTSEGGVRREATGNLIRAQVNHSTSREGDPQLHTHVVVASATYLKRVGEWRALESKSLFENQVALGLIYQNELARQALELGYNVRAHKSGTFEIDGIPERVLKAFSKATDRVEAAYERDRPSTPEAAQTAKLKDRPKKLEISANELDQRWLAEVRAEGFNFAKMVENAKSREGGFVGVSHNLDAKDAPLAELASQIKTRILGSAPVKYSFSSNTPIDGRDPEARRIVSEAIQVLEYRKAVFTRPEVLRAAFEASSSPVGLDRLQREIWALEAEGRLLPAERNVHGGLTTSDAIRLEGRVIQAIEAGRGRSTARYDEVAALQFLKTVDGPTLNAQQTSAAHMVLTSKDRILAIQGSAGVGKTTLLTSVVAGLSERNVLTVGLAPTHSAVEVMRSEARMTEAQTTSSFLTRLSEVAVGSRRVTGAEREAWSGKVVIVDEASMLSNRDFDLLLTLASKLRLEKMVFVGDSRQLGAMGAGAPFRHMIQQGAPKATVSEILRQKDPELKGAVAALSQGKAHQGVNRLGLALLEVGAGVGAMELIQRAFDVWRVAKDVGKKRPVITATQAERRAVNEKIVEHLERSGEIRNSGLKTSPLIQVHLAGGERWRLGSYQDGQVLVFNSAQRTMGVQRDEQVRVIGRGRSDRSTLLHAERQDGSRFTIDLAALARNGREIFSVFEAQKPEPIFVGAQMVFERTIKALGVRAGEKVIVKNVENGRVGLQQESGDVVRLAADDPKLRFLGPGYAMTTHRAQGLTLKVDPIAILHSRNANQAMAYVQISRAVNGVSVVTDSKERLLSRLSMRDGLNLIASENVSIKPEVGKQGLAKAVMGMELERALPWNFNKEIEKEFPRDIERALDHKTRTAPPMSLPGRGT